MSDRRDPSDADHDETDWEDLVSDDAGDFDPEMPPGDLPGGAPESTAGSKVDPEADADPLVVETDREVSAPEESILPDVLAHFETREELFVAAPEESFVREAFFDFGYRDDAEEIERYWVNEPFAYVSILRDESEGEIRYHVVEPTLSEFEQYVRADVLEDLNDVLLHVDPTEVDRGELLDEQLQRLSDRYVQRADPGSLHKIRYYIRRDILGYGRIDPLLGDRRIEDISCDGVEVPVYVYHRDYRDLATNVSFPEDELNSFVVRLAQRSGKHASVANPLVDASLPNGSRVQLTLGREVSTRGSNFTIRQFADVPITPVDLIAWGTFSVETMSYLWLAIENNLSLVFAGGTASGKTTSMNAVSMFIPNGSKVITIEDTREITLPNENWVQSVTREGFLTDEESGDVDMYKLLQAALRQRPEYLLVGEIRTEQDVALAFFQAMATGHTAYTTMHADSTETVLSRLGNPPLNVPEQMVQELDIVAIQRQIFHGGQRIRRNTGIAELTSGTEGVEATDVYEWNPADDTMERTGKSRNLRDIMHMRGWDQSDLQHELGQRQRLLRTLVDEGLGEYEQFTRIIRRYNTAPEKVMELCERGDLDRL